MAMAAAARTIRHVKRYSEILDVLVRHGYNDLITNMGLDRLIQRGYGLVGAVREPTQHLSHPERIRRVMEDLGPTFMKLGQMLSCRKDLVPEDWAKEFEKLQAEGPTLPFEAIQAVLHDEFAGRERTLFASIEEEPIAAASMAQVHRAILSDGRPVVLKILRPGTEQRTQADLEILTTIAGFVENHFANVGFRPSDVVREFAREIKREVDFTNEARSTDMLRRAFADDPNVRFPEVFWKATTKRVLALEEFKGILLSRLTEKDLSPEQRRAVVSHGADAVAKQCLEIGVFHADPHPGNLFALVQDDGSVVAGFIDCGMTGRLEPRTMDQLVQLVKGVAESNIERVIEICGAFANVPPSTLTNPIFRTDMADMVRSFEVTSFEQFDLPGLLNSLFETMRAHQLRFPSELIMLIKALTTIESVGRSIDPTFDLIAHLRPSIERVVRQRYGWRAIRDRLLRNLADYAGLIEDLPRELNLLIAGARRNNFAVNLQHRGLSKLTLTIEHASRNIGFSMMVTGLTVASAILVHASRTPEREGLQTLGIMGFIGAGVLALFYLIANRRWISAQRNDERGKQ
jgi:ubiquinone biosynthesis protein